MIPHWALLKHPGLCQVFVGSPQLSEPDRRSRRRIH